MSFTKKELAKMIDHSIVTPNPTEELVQRYCEEAKRYGFGAVSVNSSYVPLVAKLLKGTAVGLCASIAFPFGAVATDVKVFEARYCIEEGADEIDMVMNSGAFKSKNYDFVEEDIRAVVNASKEEGEKLRKNILVKVIIETGYLSDEEIVKASKLVKDAGADFVKTCTGFGPRGVTVHDIQLIRKGVGTKMGIKVAGGIRTFGDAIKLIEEGATRIGTSHSVNIIKEWHR